MSQRILASALLVALATTPALAGDGVKQLKRALAAVAGVEGYVAEDDPRLQALGQGIEAAGAEDSEEAAKTLLGVLMASLPSASVEVFAGERASDALRGMSSGEAREVVRGLLRKKKKDPQVAPPLAEVVAAWAEPASARTLAELLSQRDPQVVMAGARALGQLGIKEGVGPLIGVFAELQERGGRPIEVVGDALFAITGQAFTTQEDWEKWWGGVEETWDPSQKSEAGGTRERNLQPSQPPNMFESVEIRSRRLVLVLDTSGSMHIRQLVDEPDLEGPGEEAPAAEGSQTRDPDEPKKKRRPSDAPPLPHGDPDAPGYEPKPCTFSQCPAAKGRPGATCPSDENLPEYYNRLNRLVRQVVHVVGRFDDSVQFNMVGFSTQARPWKGRDLMRATDGNKRKAIEWLQSLRPDGVTRADLAIDEAFQFQDADTIIFVTDGAPTDASGKPHESAGWRLLLDQVQRLNKTRDVQIDVIAIAEGHTGFARGLARENGGEYVTVD